MLLALRHDNGDGVCVVYGLDSKVRHQSLYISYMLVRSKAILLANLYVNVRLQCFLNLRLESGESRLIQLLNTVFECICLLLGMASKFKLLSW